VNLRHASAIVLLLAAAPGLSSCFTGERPELMIDDTIPPLSDQAAAAVIDSLESGFPTPFTVNYTVTTRYGGLVAQASVSHDPAFGTSVSIAEVRYLTQPDGTTRTCSTITGDCVPGIDETRVSNRQLTSSIFTTSTAERIRQDLKVAVADSTPSSVDLAGHPATCVAIPVVDSNGSRREKGYCVFTDLHVVASLDTADLLIEPVSVIDSADAALFTAG